MNLQIRTRDNTVFNFKARTKSIQVIRETGDIDLDIIEKSFTPGALFSGDRRAQSKNIGFSFLIGKKTEAEYRQEYNDYVNYASRAEYIEDMDHDIRIKVEFLSHIDRPTSETGTILGTGRVELSFKILTPFWEDLTEITNNVSGTEFTTAINNSGAAETPAKFEIATTSLCDLIQIFITDPVRGIEIQDLAFGSDSTLDDYIINNETGEALLGDDEIDRTSRISNGSGFFDFPIGNFTLNFKFSVSVNVAIKYRRRYYI